MADPVAVCSSPSYVTSYGVTEMVASALSIFAVASLVVIDHVVLGIGAGKGEARPGDRARAGIRLAKAAVAASSSQVTTSSSRTTLTLQPVIVASAVAS